MAEQILIIEDDRNVLDNVTEMLALEGYRTLTAVNGGDGLIEASRQRPDLIICDIMMPMMDGFDTLRRLRADPELSATPFIFLTAKTEDSDQRLGHELGADDYLTKPFTREGLLRAIQLRMGKHASLGALEQQRNAVQSGATKGSQAILLRIAAVEGDIASLTGLIEQVTDVDVLDDQGHTALMFAVMMRNHQAARLLVAAGASLERIHPQSGLSIAAMARSLGLKSLH